MKTLNMYRVVVYTDGLGYSTVRVFARDVREARHIAGKRAYVVKVEEESRS